MLYLKIKIKEYINLAHTFYLLNYAKLKKII